MNAQKIAETAAGLVSGDRARTHGNKTDNHQRIAHLWNGILAAAGKPAKQPLDAHDVANLMEGMKIARRYAGAFNVDDYVDGAGYAAVAGEIAAEQERKDQTWADASARDAALEGCPSNVSLETTDAK